MSSACLWRPIEHQGHLPPSCDPNGLAAPSGHPSVCSERRNRRWTADNRSTGGFHQMTDYCPFDLPCLLKATSPSKSAWLRHNLIWYRPRRRFWGFHVTALHQDQRGAAVVMTQTWQSIKSCCLAVAHQTNHSWKCPLVVALAISCTTHWSQLMPLQELANWHFLI